MPPLAESDIERIHEASLSVLADTGVQLDDDLVVRLLRENGCSVAPCTGAVCIPPEVVQAALRQCPREVKLVSLDGQVTMLRAGRSQRLLDG